MTIKKKTKTTKDTVTVHAAEATVSTTGAAAAAAEVTPPPAAIPAALQPTPVASPPATSPMAAAVQQLIATIATIPFILGSLAEPATPLTIQERRTLPKMKAGGEKQIPAVLDLADQYKLVIPGGGTVEAREDMQLATLLDTLDAKLTSMQVVVADAASEARARTWDTTIVAYGFLLKLVKRIPALQTELNEMASFMARVHKDAPTVLRPTEARTLTRSRATAKEKKKEKAEPVAPPVVQVAPPAAPVPAAPAVQTPVAAPGNGAGAGTPGH